MSIKSFLKGSRAGLIIGIIVGILISGGLVYAYSQVELPGTITVTPSGTIKIFSDQSCTNEIDSLYWGEVEQNKELGKVVYVKNVSGDTVSVSCNMDVFDMWCAYSCSHVGGSYSGEKTILPQEVAEFTLSILATYGTSDGSTIAGTPIGTYDILVTFVVT